MPTLLGWCVTQDNAIANGKQQQLWFFVIEPMLIDSSDARRVRVESVIVRGVCALELIIN